MQGLTSMGFYRVLVEPHVRRQEASGFVSDGGNEGEGEGDGEEEAAKDAWCVGPSSSQGGMGEAPTDQGDGLRLWLVTS